MTKITTKEFIERARKVHGEKYSYDKTVYAKAHDKVIITCPIHGDFEQIAADHTNGHGCAKCGKSEPYNTQSFIDKSIQVHGNKYDYSKVEYINKETKVCIVCLVHGEFWQAPHKHAYRGQGCSKCQQEHSRLTKEEFIYRAVSVHGNLYDYTNTDYRTIRDWLYVTCPKHGAFKTTVNRLIYQKQGCPKCNASKLEVEIRKFLEDNKIAFEEQKKFNWLGLQSLDFYLPKENIAIECQGEQHFKPIDFFGGEDELKHRKRLDEIKLEKCKHNGIDILYYSNKKYDKNVITEQDKLLTIIKEHE